MTIGIKTNLVAAMAPEKAATTHPIVLKALCTMLLERGASVVIGDSPGGLYTPAFVKNVYRTCGLTALVDEIKAELASGTLVKNELTSGDLINAEKISDKGDVDVSLNEDFSISDGSFDGVSLKSFIYTGWLDDVDAIINFSKLKTHAMMGMSCAVKNMFGCIPGTTKPEYHMRFPEEKAFANVMVDLNEYFKPVLYVVDAIDGMEGNGPTAGEKRHIGAILSSKRPYCLDMACANIIGMGINDVQTLLVAHERGLGPKDISEVEMLGSLTLKEALVPDFKRATIHQSITFEGGGLINTLKSKGTKLVYSTKPKVNSPECIGCRKCFETCPAKAISMVYVNGASKGNAIPRIDRKKCIKCFCCQEFCPVGAMKVHYNPLGKLLNSIQR
jgi:uncharacterized protein (DUF362 family)/Pyruvate/2-oxoacid:ferredoxin oxidoreductase delta subunit